VWVNLVGRWEEVQEGVESQSGVPPVPPPARGENDMRPSPPQGVKNNFCGRQSPEVLVEMSRDETDRCAASQQHVLPSVPVWKREVGMSIPKPNPAKKNVLGSLPFSQAVAGTPEVNDLYRT